MIQIDNFTLDMAKEHYRIYTYINRDILKLKFVEKFHAEVNPETNIFLFMHKNFSRIDCSVTKNSSHPKQSCGCQ